LKKTSSKLLKGADAHIANLTLDPIWEKCFEGDESEHSERIFDGKTGKTTHAFPGHKRKRFDGQEEERGQGGKKLIVRVVQAGERKIASDKTENCRSAEQGKGGEGSGERRRKQEDTIAKRRSRESKRRAGRGHPGGLTRRKTYARSRVRLSLARISEQSEPTT